MEKQKKESSWWKLSLLIIFIVLLVGSIIAFPKKTITCYESKQETYYEREPYTVCAGYSFWTGKCNKWKTEYENVRKSRTVNEPYSKQVNWLFGDCND